jgi:hypothetical protein
MRDEKQAEELALRSAGKYLQLPTDEQTENYFQQIGNCG